MKMSQLTLAVTVVLLTGCSNMMYGGGVAPVANQNTYYGTPQVQQSPSYPPQINQPPIIQQQPAQSTVYRVPTPPPSVRNTAQPYGGVQETSPSPYANTPVRPAVAPHNTATVNDGWSVRPNNNSRNEQPPTITDTPKVSDGTPIATSATTVADNRSDTRPIRPAQSETPKEMATNRETTSTTETQVTENKTKNASPETTTVAKASNPPAQNTGTGSAVSSLLKQANAELGKGNLDGAASYLENAHRIDGKNAKILYDIANIRYHQGRYRDAETMAAKAVNTGGGNAMMKKSWSLIANARKALGDNQGAIAAAEKAASY